MAARQEALKAQPRMPTNDLGQLPDSVLAESAAGFIRQRLGAKTELEHDPLGALFELGEKSLRDVAGVRVPLGRARLRSASQRRFHFAVTHRRVVNIRGNVSGSG